MKKVNTNDKESCKKRPSEASAEETAKRKALEVAFSQIDKRYGKGSVMMLGQSPIEGLDVVSSGSILIDQALGVGGYPRGRVVEVFGPEASGKTTLALHAIAQAQQKGGICAFIDAEHALDPTYASGVGINTDDLIISQPDYGEQALDIVEMFIRAGAVDMIVVDSVAALVPKNELEGNMGDTHVGLQARLMSQALRKLTPLVHRSKTVLIFINQMRQTINSMPFAPKETTTGGNALKFYASMRLDVRRVAGIKRNDHLVGNRVAIRVVKNKVAPPFKRVEADLIFGEGICKELDLLDAALQFEVISKSGAWLVYNGKNIAQGRDQAMKLLKADEELSAEVLGKVKDAIAAHAAL